MADLHVRLGDKPATAVITLLDADGKETTPDTPPIWASSNEAVVQVKASDDGLSAETTYTGSGTAGISVTVTDNDGTVISGQCAVTVAPGEARSVEIGWKDSVPLGAGTTTVHPTSAAGSDTTPGATTAPGAGEAAAVAGTTSVPVGNPPTAAAGLPTGPVTVPPASTAPATVAANDPSVVMAGGVTPEQAAATTGQPAEAATAPTRTEYLFSGDPTTIDTNEWPTAGTSPDGKPLYHFAGDTAPGDAKGVGGQWTVYNPA